MRQAGGRQHQRQVRMNDEELVHIEAAAAAAGLSVPSFLVASAMGAGSSAGLSVAQRETLATEVFGTRRLLRRAGENLNRLTAIAQANGHVPEEVPAAAAAMQRYADTFSGIIAELDPRRSRQQ